MCCKREPWTEYSVRKNMEIQHLQIDHETKTKKTIKISQKDLKFLRPYIHFS